MQTSRINNMLRDQNKLFLVDYKINTKKNHAFSVRNTEDESKTCIITFDKKSRMAKCNCKDYIFRCGKNNIICKHCIFVINKCLGLSITDNVTGRTINNFDLLEEKIKTVQIVKRANNEAFTKNTKEIDQEDVCPICIDNIVNEEYISCPDCKNYVHKACALVWMKVNKTCIYCRSEVWKNFI